MSVQGESTTPGGARGYRDCEKSGAAPTLRRVRPPQRSREAVLCGNTSLRLSKSTHVSHVYELAIRQYAFTSSLLRLPFACLREEPMGPMTLSSQSASQRFRDRLLASGDGVGPTGPCESQMKKQSWFPTAKGRRAGYAAVVVAAMLLVLLITSPTARLGASGFSSSSKVLAVAH